MYLLRCKTRGPVKLDIVDWMEGFYDRKKIDSSIGYKTPVDAEAGLIAA